MKEGLATTVVREVRDRGGTAGERARATVPLV